MIDRNHTWELKTSNSVPYAYHSGYFTAEECERIIETGLRYASMESFLGDTGSVDNNIRRNLVSFFANSDPGAQWIYQRCADAVNSFNQQFWNFELDFIETLQFTRYDRPGDFYTNHMDMSFGRRETRKLSFSVQLSDPDTYTGSDLLFLRCGHEYYDPVRTQGTVTMFPSFQIHQVTPLVSGTRYSLVGWVIGPPFR